METQLYALGKYSIIYYAYKSNILWNILQFPFHKQ